uniref:7TM_GPCR_Srx domain-containing protein n=3 Tax=Steinernema glaseri TaxID=37863 RepID=A0A1I7ZK16_9BILA
MQVNQLAMASPNGTPEAWGSELVGRGYASSTDTWAGLSICVFSVASVGVGLLNLYLIWKLPIFHNAFGAFWVARTIGEIGANFLHVIYSGPVTMLQPKNINPVFGILSYMVGIYFAEIACSMHQYVSLNRMLAVCFPLQYIRIFTRKITIAIIIVTTLQVTCVMGLYFIFPCNWIGYGPQYYEFIFVKCPENERDWSPLGTFLNRGCTALCMVSLMMDCFTFYNIIKIKVKNKTAAKDEAFRRNVRFFAQTAVQNVSMMLALAVIVIVNNERAFGKAALYITTFDARILTYLNNGLSIILFNPEVRKFLGISKTNRQSTIHAESTNAPTDTMTKTND